MGLPHSTPALTPALLAVLITVGMLVDFLIAATAVLAAVFMAAVSMQVVDSTEAVVDDTNLRVPWAHRFREFKNGEDHHVTQRFDLY